MGNKYKLLLVGAGQVMRIHNQLEGYPADIIGNYGLGGNDESVYKSDFNYITIDDYRDFGRVTAHLLD